jgi:hypothetical protein
MTIITIALSIIIIIQLVIILKLRKEVKWFRNWGKTYVSKYRDEAERDGLTK